MPEIDEMEELRYKRMIDNLARQLVVSKDDKWDGMCVRDKKTGAVVCAAKKYISDSVHKVSGYVKIGGMIVTTKGDDKDIERLQKTIGP